MNPVLQEITREAASINRRVTLMEVCGGHTHTIMNYGIRDILPDNVRLISGPGCPVCVTSQYDIDCMIRLASEGVPVATYGDMLRVPGSETSLEDAKAAGAPVHTVYSAREVLELKEQSPRIVFFGIGFETTAPMTAYLLKHDVTVYSVHKLIPPALQSLVRGSVSIDGFIAPGHVATITGMQAFREVPVPQVTSGFSAEQVLRSIYMLLYLIRKGHTQAMNGYPEVVTENGNQRARELLSTHFTVTESDWRGLGTIPASGLEAADERLNARLRYADILQDVTASSTGSCRCGEVLQGLVEPTQCPLFGHSCTPESPEGACMVSEEGSCQIAYRFRGEDETR